MDTRKNAILFRSSALLLISLPAILHSQTIQAPALPGAPAISARDRVYTADQTSNTISVINPISNTLLGTLALGNARPDDLLAPNYNRQIDVHGLGFSRDGSLLCVVSVTSNALTLVETATNKIRGTVYLGRAPHECFPTPDGKQIWVAVRGQDYVSVVDTDKLQEIDRIQTADGASKVVFRPDGQVAFVDHTRAAELDVIDVGSRKVIRRVTALDEKFTSDMMVSPDGLELWLPHKMSGKLTILDAQNFNVLGVIETGPGTNHPNFVTKPEGKFAYLTVGGLDQVKVYERNGGNPRLITVIPTGPGPHGIWPSPDNTRVYVALENGDAVQVIDTRLLRVIDTIRIGQSPQALVYVANAVPDGEGTNDLGNQNVGLRIDSTRYRVDSGTVTIVVRELVGVDSVEVEGEGLQKNHDYKVFAIRENGSRQLIADFRTDEKGKGNITAQLKFFAVGLSAVHVKST